MHRATRWLLCDLAMIRLHGLSPRTAWQRCGSHILFDPRLLEVISAFADGPWTMPLPEVADPHEILAFVNDEDPRRTPHLVLSDQTTVWTQQVHRSCLPTSNAFQYHSRLLAGHHDPNKAIVRSMLWDLQLVVVEQDGVVRALNMSDGSVRFTFAVPSTYIVKAVFWRPAVRQFFIFVEGSAIVVCNEHGLQVETRVIRDLFLPGRWCLVLNDAATHLFDVDCRAALLTVRSATGKHLISHALPMCEQVAPRSRCVHSMRHYPGTNMLLISGWKRNALLVVHTCTGEARFLIGPGHGWWLDLHVETTTGHTLGLCSASPAVYHLVCWPRSHVLHGGVNAFRA